MNDEYRIGNDRAPRSNSKTRRLTDLLNLDGSQISQADHDKAVELIDVYSATTLLSDDVKLSLLLKKATILQQHGNVASALRTIQQYEELAQGKYIPEYYLCKGKILSQTCINPDTLGGYLECVEKSSVFSSTKIRSKLSSLYWRTSILWYRKNMNKSDLYLSIHRDLSESEQYQMAHNRQLIGFSSVVRAAQEPTQSILELEKYSAILIQSVYDYQHIENFQWLEKCLLSNLLMVALIDYLAGSYIKYYKKLFCIRSLFKSYVIKANDEAISEIVSIVKLFFPESFSLLFCKDLPRFIKTHAFGKILREIYLDADYELVNYMNDSSVDLIKLYEHLVLCS